MNPDFLKVPDFLQITARQSPDFFKTIAGQRFCANIASIAQSLRVIAEAVKERKEY